MTAAACLLLLLLLLRASAAAFFVAFVRVVRRAGCGRPHNGFIKAFHLFRKTTSKIAASVFPTSQRSKVGQRHRDIPEHSKTVQRLPGT